MKSFVNHRKTNGWFSMILALLLLFVSVAVKAQMVPSLPNSYQLFHPMIINPAYVGSKDFTNISLTTKISKYPTNQILNYHQRFKGADGEYASVGGGAYVFHERLNASWNTGLALAGAYHLPLDDEGLHNLSMGASLKGFITAPRDDVELYSDSATAVFKPNVDLGVYYYGPLGFAGLSVTTLAPGAMDSASAYSYIDRHYHLVGGYKFVVDKKNGIVIEPSIVLSVNDDNIKELHKHITPYLRVYLQNFYVGSYLKDLDTFALFFQYQFPRFYTGLFLEFPTEGYLNDDNIIFEISLGVNLGDGGAVFSKHRHW